VTVNAQADADAAYVWLEKAIEGLSALPNRCPLARENREFEEPVRQLLYGKSPHVYRVLFIVRANVVSVLHVRTGARQALTDEQVILPPDE
jgi:hypothetical protein